MNNRPTQAKAGIWTASFILITGLSFLVSVIQLGFSTSLPVHVTNLGLTASDAGMTLGFFALSAMVGRPIWGSLLDRINKAQIYLIGAGLFAIGGLLFAFPAVIERLDLILFARILQGLGFSSLTTAAGAMIADILPREKLAEGIGYYSLSGTVSNAFGPMLALGMAQSLGFLTMFRFQFSLMVLTLILILPLLSLNPQELASIHPTQPLALASAKRPSFWQILVEPTAIPSSVLFLSLAVIYGGLISFLPVLIEKRQIGSTGIYFAIQAVAVILTRVVTRRMLAHWGLNRLVSLSYLLVAASMLCLVVAQQPIWLYFSATFFGLGFGLAFPLLNARILQLCPANKRGQANATFFLAMDLGVGVGSIALGFLARQLGFESVFFVSIGLALLTFTATLFLLKDPQSAN